jgi:hypothetical protein
LTKDQRLKRWPLDDWYLSCGIPVERIVKFAELLGCQKEFDKIAVTANCIDNPHWSSTLSKAPGERAGNVVNRDFALSPEAVELLRSNDVAAVRLVWKALCRGDSSRPSILEAVYQITDRGGPCRSPSQLVCTLRDLAWVPQTEGTFVKPSQAVIGRLPKGFSIDAGYKWLEAIVFGVEERSRSTETAVRAKHRKELGFESEEELGELLSSIGSRVKRRTEFFLRRSDGVLSQLSYRNAL